MKNRVGEKCWQSIGYSSIIIGVVVSQEMRDKWLMYEVRWGKGTKTTWVKCNNVSFHLPTEALDLIK